MILVSKIVTVLAWIVIIINWFVPLGGAYPYLNWGGIFLVIAHPIEAAVFLPKAKQAGGNLALHIIQLVIFGYPHVMELDQAIAAKSA